MFISVVDFHLLMFRRVIVQRAVGNGADVSLLRLAHPRHVYQHELWRMDAVGRSGVLLHHCLVHLMVECDDLLFVVHSLVVSCLLPH